MTQGESDKDGRKTALTGCEASYYQNSWRMTMDEILQTNPTETKPRRVRKNVEAMKPRMMELEAAGMSRRNIAIELGVTPSQVTNTLGAVQIWKGRRNPPISEPLTVTTEVSTIDHQEVRLENSEEK